MTVFKKEHVQDMYPLSPMQEGMLYHYLDDQNSDSYFVQVLTPVYGELDVDLLIKSFGMLVERYEVFRTTFLYEKIKRPLQIVLSERSVDTYVEKLICSTNQEKNDFIEKYLKKDRNKSFDLSTDSLVRLSILQVDEQEWTVVFSFHHIVMDGWCSDIVFNDLFNLYSSLLKGTDSNLQAFHPYSKYIAWLDKQDEATAKKYWRELVSGYEELAEIPILRKSDKLLSYRHDEFSLSIEEDITKKLSNIAKQNQVTLNTLMQTIWGIVLQKYNDRKDVVFGSVVAGRPAEILGVEKMIGLFINTIPTRILSKENQTFQDLIVEVHEQILKSQQFDYFPLSSIQNESVGQKLFNHILVFDNNVVTGKWKEENLCYGIKVGEQRVIEHTNYDLSITITPKNKLNIKFIYNANIFSKRDILRISEHIVNVINCVCNDISVRIEDVSLITPIEAQQLMHFNNTNMIYPKEKTIADLFEIQVRETPDNTALIYEGETLTYNELNKKANQIAYLLQKKGVKADDLIGLMVERSFEMVIGILGILKSNGAYLPLDPENPVQRLVMILEDSKPSILLVQRSSFSMVDGILKLLKNHKVKCFIIEDLLSELKQVTDDNPNRTCESHNLGYVMYTSGSTGKPKGILTQQYNIIRVIKNTNYIDLKPDDTVLQLSNFAFDGSTFDIFGALLNGARLVLVSKETVLETNKLLKVIEDEDVSVFFVTTALFNTLVDLNLDRLAHVRKILFGGERASLSHVKKALEYMGKGKILHMYGPTENTVYTTFYEVNQIDSTLGTVPIGVPLANTEIYILSKESCLQPIGVIGELCVAGDGLARGYLNNSVLTEEKFVEHPFLEGKRLYKTGDLARWLEDGTIEFVGRRDHQIKLSGFRIELGEVEYQILNYEPVKEVVIVDCQDSSGVKKLCVYFVANRKIATDELRKFLSGVLPYYMIPALFIQMEYLPLNVNGKVDRSILPEPDWSNNNVCQDPRDELEEKLVEIWKEVLGINKVSIVSNYFHLGGDSIKAIQICARLREQMLTLNVKDIFQNPTIVELKQCVKSIDKKDDEKDKTNQQVLKNTEISIDTLSELEEELKAINNNY